MFNSDRHKKAKIRGYQARLNNRPQSDSYYTPLGKRGQVYASLWDAGWNDANRVMEAKK